MTYPTVDEIIAKVANGQTLTPWERSVYRLNVRPDGSRYSTNADIRERQYEDDIRKDAK